MRVLILMAALAVAVLLVFQPVTGNDFILLDDDLYVTDNLHVRAGLTPKGAAWAFTGPDPGGNWHPLTWLSHMLDVRLFGLDPAGHHLVSLLLHAGNTLLLFLVLARMTGAPWPSAFAAALFGVHPLHVESVAWVAERKDVLSTFFWMLAVGAWLRYLRRPQGSRYAAVLVIYALALMAKPMPVTFPFVLLLLDYWPLRRIGQPGRPMPGEIARLVIEKTPLLFLAAASSAVTLAAQARAGAVGSLESYPLGPRLAYVPVAYLRYLGRTVWPGGLGVYYPYPDSGLPSWQPILSLAILGALTMLALRGARRMPWLAVGWLWFLGTLVPVIGIVQVGSQAMADRYTYVPLIGIFAAGAWGLVYAVQGSRRRALALAAPALVLLILLMAAARNQVHYWRDSEALFRHTLSVTRDNWMIRYNLAVLYDRQGRDDEAIAEYREELRIVPGDVNARLLLAEVLERKGLVREAAEEYDLALRFNPEDAPAHYNLGRLLAARGDQAGAEEHYRASLALNAGVPMTHNNLGIVLAAQGRYEEALVQYREALRLDPGFAAAHFNMALDLEALGRIDEAVIRYREALRLQPDSREARLRLELALRLSGGALRSPAGQ